MKNCIYALTRGYTDFKSYDTLLARNKAIENNLFNILGRKYRIYDVDYILFHEGNITLEHQKSIQDKTNIPLKFVEIVFDNNNKEIYTNNNGHLVSRLFHNRTKDHGWATNNPPWGLNYRHMCHFYFVDILEHLKNYKYALRIDEDCIIHNQYNYFDVFNNCNLKLVSGKFQWDVAHATINLSQFSQQFIKDNKLNVDYKNYTGGPYTNVLLVL